MKTLGRTPAAPGVGTIGGGPAQYARGVVERSPHRRELLGEAGRIANALEDSHSLAERLAIYREVGRIYGSESRRVLNISAPVGPKRCRS
jgi:hypothetical protein